MKAREVINQLREQTIWQQKAIHNLLVMAKGRILRCGVNGLLYRVHEDAVEYWNKTACKWLTADKDFKRFGTGVWTDMGENVCPEESQRSVAMLDGLEERFSNLERRFDAHVTREDKK